MNIERTCRIYASCVNSRCIGYLYAYTPVVSGTYNARKTQCYTVGRAKTASLVRAV